MPGLNKLPAISPMFRRGGGGTDAISDDIAFYYKLNGNARRSYGTYDGGANVTWATGALGQAAVFDGLDGFIAIDDSADFNFSGDFTVGILLKPTLVNGTTQSFVGQGNSGGANESYGFLFRISDADKFVALIKTDENAGSFVALTSASDVVQDQWQLFIIKREGDDYTMKVNDVLEASDTDSFNYQSSAYKVCLGRAGEFSGSQWFNGQINRLFGWNRALTDVEETELYNGGVFLDFNSALPVQSSNDLQLKFLDVDTIGFSSFQSHNQKTVTNQYGTFYCYSKSAANFPLYDWVLSRTTDEGVTFTEVDSRQSHIEPTAVIETDSDGNLYLINFISGTEIECIKYSAPEFTAGTPVEIGSLVAHKCAMNMDEVNDKIYFFVSNVMLVMDMDFAVVSQETVLFNGVTYGEEYPCISIDSDNGWVYLGWTTAIPNTNSGYRSIQCMRSTDFCATWEALDGTAITIPAVSDETGPTTQLSNVADLGTSQWMGGFTVANQRLHILYSLFGTPQIQRYKRFNLSTGVEEVSTDNPLGNVPEKFPDGAFIRIVGGTHASPTTLYFMTENNYKVASAKSTDNGTTWGDVKESDQSMRERNYSVGTYREVYDDKCFGLFTGIRTWPPTELYTDEFSGYTYLMILNL